jgi:hypothetical protein
VKLKYTRRGIVSPLWFAFLRSRFDRRLFQWCLLLSAALAAPFAPARAEFLLSDQSSEIYYNYGLVAGQQITVQGGSQVTGNVHANGTLHLARESRVTGNVSAGRILLQGTVSGTVKPGAPALPLPRLFAKEELRALADRVLTGDQQLTNPVINDVLFVDGTVLVKGSLNGTGTLIATRDVVLEEIAGRGGVRLDPGTRISLIALNDILIGRGRPLRGALYAGRDAIFEKELSLDGVVIAQRNLSIAKDSSLRFLDFDQKPPVLSLVTPRDGALLADPRPPIEIAFSDEFSGIKLSTLRFLLDGTDRTGAAAVSETGLRFTPPQPLAQGAHVIDVALSDHSANQARATFRFVIDTLPPVISIASPTEGQVINETPVPVNGTVTDASAIASLTVNGRATPLSGNAFSASVDLVAGANSITVQATDAAGNTGSATVSVTLSGDSIPPEIAITSPLAGAFVLQGQPEIAVTFSDESGVDPATLALTTNGSSLAANCQTEGEEARCIPAAALPEGTVTIAASIADLFGNRGTASVKVIVDTVPLEVSLTVPTSGLITRDAEVTVAGTVSNGVERVAVNGVPASLSGGGFSATVPLREGGNMIVALATKTNGRTGTASIEVTRDLAAPVVRIDSPRDGLVSVEDRIGVTGLVNDIVTGGATPRVLVNGVEATVANGSFALESLPLVRGPNTIEAVATDAVGNTGRHAITVIFERPIGARLGLASGNGQSAFVQQALPQPLVAVVKDDLGNPVAGRIIRFEVTRNSGTLRASTADAPARVVQVPTDGSGRASVLLTLGDTAGEGNNRVIASALGVAGEVEFCASAFPTPPDKILMTMGDNQRGVVGQPLPMPLVALVVDKEGNPIPGVDVTFTVVQGMGHLDGATSLVKKTGIDGQVKAVLTLGFEPGINNNVVNASYEGLTGLPATFTASGLTPGDPAQTRFSGVVLDNAHTPIPGAVVSIHGTPASATTDDQGQFLIENVPVGHIHLHIDPSNSPRPETFPPLAFETVTIAGQNNNLGQPILIPALDLDNSKIVGGNQDVALTMEGVEGFSLTVFANSATFPDGSKVGRITVSQVHLDKVPMAPPGGTIFMPPAWTLQPPGVHFNPPIRVTIPNNGLPPGRMIDLFQFDHHLNQFINIGPATVAADGATITSDPGFGITAAGWGGGGRPQPPTTRANACDDKNPCTEDEWEDGGCDHRPINEGNTCTIAGGKSFSDKKIKINIDESCSKGTCVKGKCKPKSDRWGYDTIKKAAKDALDKIFEKDCLGPITKVKMQEHMRKIKGYVIICVDSGDSNGNGSDDCASSAIGGNSMNFSNAMVADGCGSVAKTVRHEMQHSSGDRHTPQTPEVDPVFGCDLACYNESNEPRAKKESCR